MNAGKIKFDDQAAGVKIWKALFGRVSARGGESLPAGGRLLGLGLGVALLCGIPALGQPRQTLLGGETDRSPAAGAIAGLANSVNAASATATANLAQLGGQQGAGTISGTVVDPTGGVVVGARVKLSGADPSQSQEVISDEEGKFSLAGIAPGPFQLTVTAEGFVAQIFSGTVNSGAKLCRAADRAGCGQQFEPRAGHDDADRGGGGGN